MLHTCICCITRCGPDLPDITARSADLFVVFCPADWPNRHRASAAPNGAGRGSRQGFLSPFLLPPLTAVLDYPPLPTLSYSWPEWLQQYIPAPVYMITPAALPELSSQTQI